jgi:hypothetical protein
MFVVLEVTPYRLLVWMEFSTTPFYQTYKLDNPDSIKRSVRRRVKVSAKPLNYSFVPYN